MAQKLLSKVGARRKVAPTKAAVDAPKRIVLVCTYAARQLEKWPGYYNYPLYGKDRIDVEAVKKVNELWLFSGAKLPRYFAAECLGVKTREELKEFGYKATGKGHGSGKYLLFKIKKLYAPSRDFAESVTIRTKDFAGQGATQKQLKEYLESPDRKDPLLAKMLPKIVIELPRERLRVCEAAVQLDFLRGLGFCLWTPPNVMRAKQNNYNFISLFTGAGGLDIGFREAGFRCLFASDIMKEAAETYRLNNPETPFECTDVRLLQTSHIKEVIGRESVDVIVGGPPCQGFSNMGNKNSGDPRNLLFESYVRIVNDFRPKCFLFENVKGLYTMFEGRFFDKVVAAFIEIGYDLYFSILNAAEYGVPQKRERIIIVGTRMGTEFRFPDHSSDSFGGLQAFANVGDAIGDLVGRHEEVPNHIALGRCQGVLRH